MRRRERAERARAYKLIYLDTNAWKCAADFRQKKGGLTSAMQYFGTMLEKATRSGLFAFPIGAPTLFELDSMVESTTRDTLNQLVDELCRGLCIIPYHERLEIELTQLRTQQLEGPEGLDNFLFSPLELLGIPQTSSTDFLRGRVDKLAFDKALFDALSEMPFSTQLESSRDTPDKWDNTKGISELNAGKIEHQNEISTLHVGMFNELKGCVGVWFEAEGIEMSPKDIATYAAKAIYHWEDVPGTRALPTMRTLCSTYGLMRFDSTRRYRDGDPNDFMVAASALPVADAFFTDKKLANLLADKRIKVRDFSDCEVISGFEQMGHYLEKALHAELAL
jgi:hypothetical protein